MSRYKLTNKELLFLLRGETGGYRKRELRNRIEEKAERTPARLQGLCADIDVLYRHGYLDENGIEFSPVFRGEGTRVDDICNVFSRPSHRYRDDGTDESAWSTTELRGVPPAELGLRIGQMVNHATEDPNNSDIEYSAELVCGFIEGLCYYDRILRKDGDEVDHEHRTEIVDKLTDKLFTTEAAYHTARSEDVTETLEEIRRSVRAAVSDEPDLKRLESDAAKYARYDVMVGDLEIEDITDEYVKGVIAEQNLREPYRSAAGLDAAVERLQTQRYKGVYASDVVGVLDGANVTKSSNEIAEKIDEHSGGVTVVAESLAGVDRDRFGVSDDDIWSDEPIVEGDKDGWALTESGEEVVRRLNTS